MRITAGHLKRLSLAVGLLLGAGAQGIAEDATFPIDGAYGTPGACARYRFGGEVAVFNGGITHRNGTMLLFDESETSDDDPVLLIQPTSVTAFEFRCKVVGKRGDDIDLSCGYDGIDEMNTVHVTPVETGLKLDWGDYTHLLEPCQPAS